MIRRRNAPKLEEKVEGPKGFDDFDLRLGDIMRGERATLAKSLLDVQRELKIKATYIAAIENSDPSAFETPGFIAGYVRSYARYLNLDPEWAYTKFCQEGNFVVAHGMSAAASGAKTGKVDVAKNAGAKKDPFVQPNTPFVPNAEGIFSRIEPGALGSVLVLVTLIGFIGYGGWAVLQEVQRVQFAPVDQTPGVTAQVDPLAPADNFADGASNDTVLMAPAPEALDRLYRPQALEVPVLTARDAPISTLDPRALATVTQAAPDLPPSNVDPVALAVAEALSGSVPETPAVRVHVAGVDEVVMFAVRPSWVRVKSQDGTVLFEKILDTGEGWALPNTEVPPMLRAGNAGGIYFSVDGEVYGPAGQGPSIVKQVALGADDLKAVYGVAQVSTEIDLGQIIKTAVERRQASQ